MYVTVQDFVQDYQEEMNATQKLLDRLTDESLKQPIAEGYRTLGHIAWHLVPSGGIFDQAGLKFESPSAGGYSRPPVTAAEIAQAYGKAAQAVIEAVKKQWTDADLQVEQIIFGQKWQNGKTLLKFVKHEIHHRGQLTILMRQADVPVTGMYGPAKEEWKYAGLEAPALL
jgi:uncharacterized damage-inducible protein DinB